jgi:hypothetical protein
MENKIAFRACSPSLAMLYGAFLFVESQLSGKDTFALLWLSLTLLAYELFVWARLQSSLVRVNSLKLRTTDNLEEER